MDRQQTDGWTPDQNITLSADTAYVIRWWVVTSDQCSLESNTQQPVVYLELHKGGATTNSLSKI